MSKPLLTSEDAFSEAYDFAKAFPKGVNDEGKNFGQYLSEKYNMSPVGGLLGRLLIETNTFVAYDLIVERLEFGEGK